jgi:uncharacterized protein involved in exopolysaccharide biosynthesis
MMTGCQPSKTYSATAEIEVSPLQSIDDTIDTMRDSDFLQLVVIDLQLDRAWGSNFIFERHFISLEEATQRLRSILKFEPVAGTNDIKIIATSADPQEAANIANAIADNFVQTENETRKSLGDDARDALSQSIVDMQKKYEAAQATLKQNPNDAEALRTSDGCKKLIDELTDSVKHKGPHKDAARVISHATVSAE